MFGLIRLTLALAAFPVRVALIPVRMAGRQMLRIPAVRRAADRAARVLPKSLRGGGGKKAGKGKAKKTKADERREAYLAARTPRPGETPGSARSGGQGGDAARMQAQMQKQMMRMQEQQMRFQRQQFEQQQAWMQRNTMSVADLAKMLTKHLASKEGNALDIAALTQELAQRGVAPAVAQAAIREAHGKGWIKKAGSGRVAASAKSVRARGVPDEVAQRRQRRAM